MDLMALVRANPDRVTAVGLVIVGAVAVVLGWIGVSGTGLAAEQIPYLVSGGIGGLLLVVVGCTAWVSADLQDEWRRMDAIEDHLAKLAQTSDGTTPTTHGAGPEENGSSPVATSTPAASEP
jgi:hypothetical protein